MFSGSGLSAFGPGGGGGGRSHLPKDGAVLASKKQLRLSGQSSWWRWFGPAFFVSTFSMISVTRTDPQS